MKQIWIAIPLVLAMLFIPACSALGIRPAYPPTYTPLPPSPTKPLTTLGPTEIIPTAENQPTFTPYPIGLDSVWAPNEVDRTLTQIDPISRNALQIVRLEGVPKAVEVGEGAVWAVEAVSAYKSNLVRIDPYSALVTHRIPILTGEAISLAIGDGAVWVGTAGEWGLHKSPGGGVDFSQKGKIVRIDPRTRQVSEVIDVGYLPNDLLIEGREMWILEKRRSYSYLTLLDLDTRKQYLIPETVESAEYIHKFANFTKLGVWMWMTPQDITASYIFRVSTLDGIVQASVPTGNNPLATPAQLATDGTYVWAALRNGDVAKIDPLTSAVEKYIETEASNLSDIFYQQGYIWAFSQGDATLFQIDPIGDEVLKAYTTGSQPPPTPTPTASTTPNPNLIWQLCSEAFPTRLYVGIRAMVNREPPIPSRVRMDPNGDSLIVGYIDPGEEVKIVSGPICYSGWVWWYIESMDGKVKGWSSEGNGNEYWLVPK